MILFRYLARRFLLYVVTISFFLAFIFNFVEFFEKLMRVKNVDAATISHFLGLNFMPTFFDVLVIGTWLATCLLLKELCLRHEWELLQLLTYIPRRLLVFMLSMGILLSTSALFFHEKYVATLAFKAERFKQEKLKQGVSGKLVSMWLELDQNRFCYFSVLDSQLQKGEDLLLITMAPDFTLQSVIKASTFNVDFKSMMLTIPRGVMVESHGWDEKVETNKTIFLPSFFSQLRINLEVPTLISLIKKITVYGHLLPSGVYNELLGQLLARVGYFLQLLLYPLVTLCLFMMLYHPFLRWVAALSAYPLFVVATLIGNALFHYGLTPWVLLLPYLVIMLAIGLYWRRHKGVFPS